MFLRKLFSSNNKLAWVLIDLTIVIIGVYSAFLIQSYAEEQRTLKEKEKVLSALKFELENFRVFLPGRSTYAQNQVRQWSTARDEGRYADFSNWVFIEPQYKYQIIEYAIGIENNNIVDFRLFNALQDLFAYIKRLENAERLIMQMSLDFAPVPDAMPEPARTIRLTENYERFKMFIRFSEGRSENLQLVANASATALEIINADMDSAQRRAIEEELILGNIKTVDSAQAIPFVMNYFPHLTQEEVLDLYRRAE